ncbi:MAG TPA: hypothetical protein VMX54_07340 [Vicinamibacteria bacterium]|nr:hypothetical protein [Vicinamibacteria bacterium]
MDSTLTSLLDARAGALGRDLATALFAHDAPHYREMPAEEVRARCDRLVAAFLEAVRGGGPEPFVRHLRGIVEQRVAEGFLLREVQQALSLLEAAVWPLAEGAGGDTATVVRRLAVVTGIVGQGKDELARAFLDQLERCGARASSLQRRLDELFRGTEPTPQG